MMMYWNLSLDERHESHNEMASRSEANITSTKGACNTPMLETMTPTRTTASASTPSPSKKQRNEPPFQPSSLARSLPGSLYHVTETTDDSVISQQSIDDRNTVIHELFGWTVGDCLGEFYATYFRIPGQFFVARRALLFYSNWLSFERRLCLTLGDIDAIESYRSTSIKIVMVDCEEYVFKRFQNRDAVVQVLQELLRRFQNGMDYKDMITEPPLGSEISPLLVSGSVVSQSPRTLTDSFDKTDRKLGDYHLPSLRGDATRRPHLSLDFTLENDTSGESCLNYNRRRAQSVPTVIPHDFKLLPVPSSSEKHASCELLDAEIPVLPESLTTTPANNVQWAHSAQELEHTLSSYPKQFMRKLRTSSSSDPNGKQPATNHPHSNSDAANKQLIPDSSVVETVSSSSSVQEQTHHIELFKKWCNTNKTYDNVALPKMCLPCTVDEFFSLFFHNSAPYSLAKYQEEKIGDKNISFGQWKAASNGSEAAVVHSSCMERSVDFIHPLGNAMGPSEAKTFRKQTLQRYGNHAIIIQNSTQVDGIPMADCFQVKDQWIVQAEQDEPNTISVSVFFEIDFMKRTMFKSLIQKNVKAETKKWFQGYACMLQQSLKDYREAGNGFPQKSSAVFESPKETLLSSQQIMNATDQPGAPVTITNGVGSSLSFHQLLMFVPSMGNDAVFRGAVLIILVVLILQVASLQKALEALERHLFEMQMQNKQLLDHVAQL
jgi:hypothetical protein